MKNYYSRKCTSIFATIEVLVMNRNNEGISFAFLACAVNGQPFESYPLFLPLSRYQANARLNDAEKSSQIKSVGILLLRNNLVGTLIPWLSIAGRFREL
jgi:hypothetical protein